MNLARIASLAILGLLVIVSFAFPSFGTSEDPHNIRMVYVVYSLLTYWGAPLAGALIVDQLARRRARGVRAWWQKLAGVLAVLLFLPSPALITVVLFGFGTRDVGLGAAATMFGAVLLPLLALWIWLASPEPTTRR